MAVVALYEAYRQNSSRSSWGLPFVEALLTRTPTNPWDWHDLTATKLLGVLETRFFLFLGPTGRQSYRQNNAKPNLATIHALHEFPQISDLCETRAFFHAIWENVK